MGRDHRFGPFLFDGQRLILFKQGAPVPVGRRALAVLEVLLAAGGQAVSKSKLIDLAWPGESVEESNLTVQVAALRKCLGRSPSGEEWIATVQRLGYQFVDPDAGASRNSSGRPDHNLPAAAKPAIAVLPFANLGSDPQQGYLCDGIAEDIMTELGRSSSMMVMGRSSSARFRGGAHDVRETGHTLGARYLVDGSVRSSGSQLRISVQLIDVDSGRQLWSEHYDRRAEEIFHVQDDIVRAIVMTCEHRIIDREFEARHHKPNQNWAAYDYILQARYFLRGYDTAGQAEAPAQRAIELDPDNSQPHAQLAFVTMNKFWTTGERTHIDTARAFARAALERDDMDTLAHSAMALVSVFRGEGDMALMHAERAVALNPNDVIAANELSQVLVYLGRPVEALVGLDSILERDPFPPQWYWETRGMVLFHLRRCTDSIDAFRHIVKQHPWERGHVIAAFAHDGRMAEAKRELAELLAQAPDISIDRLLNFESYIDAASREHYADGLRKAGVPE